MKSRKPTVLFVHGSWHQPSHFRRCRDVFEAAGFPTSCPLQPSIDALPPIGLMDDARRISDELELLVNQQDQDVIVIAHSYGGIVATQGVKEVFAKKKRLAEGKEGGVLHILYMCAFLLPLNVSLSGAFASIFGGGLPPFIHDDERGICKIDNPAQMFYTDLPEDEQKHWVSELRESPTSTQLTPITYCAYLHHPFTYLYCVNDGGLPYAIQQQMVKDVSDTYNIEIRTESCEAAHSPFLSMPEKVLEVVENLAV